MLPQKSDMPNLGSVKQNRDVNQLPKNFSEFQNAKNSLGATSSTKPIKSALKKTSSLELA